MKGKSSIKLNAASNTTVTFFVFLLYDILLIAIPEVLLVGII
jgi:hypothetical protein